MPSVLDPPDLNSWDRQRDEKPAQWFAFRYWRDRNCTYTEVAEAAGVSPGTIASWAHEWSWKIRKADYDRSLDGSAQAAARLTAETMGAAHLTAAAQLREVGLGSLRRLYLAGEVDPTTISASAAVRAVAEGAKLERLTFGQPTDIQDTKVVDYSKLTDEEWDELCRLQAKAEG